VVTASSQVVPSNTFPGSGAQPVRDTPGRSGKGTTMFTATLDKLSGNLSDTLKPYAQTIADALYIIAGLAAMILLALLTR
jgi:hypothetical protein